MKSTTLTAAAATTAAALSSFFLPTSSFSYNIPFCLAAINAPGSVTHPNIVYFLVDDMGFADCAFNHGKDVFTPNIDALSRKGVILENYYVQPLCSATRCTLMTGRMPNRHGVYGALKTESRYGLPLDERILPQLLKTAGYTSAIVGKWHCGEYKPEYRPMHRGWDHQYGLWYGQIDYFTHFRGGREDWYRDDQPLHEKGYSTHLIGQEAIRLIKEHAAATTANGAAAPKVMGASSSLTREQDAPATLAGAAAPTVNREPETVNRGGSAAAPLFLYIPFNADHGPFQVPAEYEKPYPNLKPDRRRVAGMLSVVDEVIGKVYKALQDAGMADNTLIIFSSDNGGVAPGVRTDNSPLRDGKGSIYEGGVRSCGFVIWPGHITPGTKVSAPVQLVDWYPTFAALTGADLSTQKKKLDGQNILPLLTEGKAPDRDALLIVGTSIQRYALRMGDWKLLVNPKGPGKGGAKGGDPDDADDTEVITNDHLELYNLATDIGEKHNLADAEPARLKAMYARAKAMMSDAVPNLATTSGSKAATKAGKGKRK